MNDEVYRCEICGKVPVDWNFYNPYLCATCGKKVCIYCKNIHNVEQHGWQPEGKPISMIEKIQAEARKKVEPKVQYDDDGNEIPF